MTLVLALAVVCLFFLSSPFLAEAQSKNFYYPNVRIEINIARDGSFTVDEYRTYDFQGSFSGTATMSPSKTSRSLMRVGDL